MNRNRFEDALEEYIQEVSDKTGIDFFRSLVRQLAKSLNADFSFVGQEVGGLRDRMRTIAVWSGDGPIDNFDYDLANSPCRDMTERGIRYYRQGVQKQFPLDRLLVDRGIESYLAAPLVDSMGSITGLLAVLHKEPLQDEATAQSLFKIIAGRASSELERMRAEALLSGEKRVLEMLARGAKLPEMLEALAANVEEQSGEMLCSILLLDRNGINLRHGAAPSLPQAYNQAVDGIAIGPESGSCGTAAYRKELVIVSDIATDPLWVKWKDLALSHGLQACWSAPILSKKSDVLGTFAMYYRTPRSPEERDLRLIDRAVYLAGIAIESKRAEEDQWELERKLRLIADNAAEAILAYDMNRHLIYVNPAVEEQTGYSVDEMRARQFIKWVHPEDDARMMDLWEKLYQGQGYSGAEFRIVTKDGRVKWILGSWGPLWDENGKQLGVQGRELDITDRKEAEERLRKSEMSLAKAQQTAHLGSWEQDLASGVLEWSEETYRIFGLPPGRPITEEFFFSCVHPDDRAAVRKAAREALDEHTTYSIDHRIVRLDGSERWVHEQGEYVFDDRGQATRMVGTVQDITERKLLEDQLRQAMKMEAVGRLAGGVAHDFNNLLTAIIGHSELVLKNLDATHQLRQDIEQIRVAGERAASLTRQLLAFSRKQMLQPQVLDPSALVGNMIKMLRRLIGEDIQLVEDLQPSPWSVKADPGQLEQILLNLVINARDAMPQGGKLTLSVRNVEVDEFQARKHRGLRPGRYAVMSVKDTGKGMDAATQSRIFEPFFTTKEAGKGTGLGLSTVYGVVKQSEGYIGVQSEVAVGTTFDIYLPRVDEKAAPVQPSSSATRRLSGSETILLVEDDQLVRNLVRTILGTTGYHVLEARNPIEALQMVESDTQRIHLLITDVVMGTMSGRRLAESIQTRRPETKVLFMSGHTDDAIVHYGLIDLKKSFLQKPFSAETLLRKVREVLEGE